VLPGVGAFDDAMRRLTASGMADALRAEVVQAGRPFLGVCLGMQLMAEVGEEGIGACGLGFIGGRVERFVPVNGERIPHMGWNEVTSTNESPLFAGIPAASDFYFVHSYHLTRTTSDIAKTPYCGGFVSAVQRDHLFGVQFHPEKSQRAGFALLKNFLSVQ
jgi:glutamine amidotransferase